jgi:hypothetical protein
MEERIPWQTFSKPVVAVGARKPLNSADANSADAEFVHGRNGLGGVTEQDIQMILETFGSASATEKQGESTRLSCFNFLLIYS